LTYSSLSSAVAAAVLVAGFNSSAIAQDDTQSTRIAATIAAHDETSPVTMWNPEDWPGTSVDDFLSLMPDQLHRTLGPAWEEAGEGSVSGTGCAGLFMGMGARLETEATEADDLTVSMQGLDGCHVAVLARYLSVRLEPGQAALDGCIGEMVAVNRHRSVASSMLRDADPDGVILSYLDLRLDTIIGDVVRTACPGMAAEILGSAS